jgi:hypothetical protein
MAHATSRRAILAGLSSLPAIGAPLALATTVDPIVAAHDRERAAWDAFDKTCKADDEAGIACRRAGLGAPPRVQVGTYTSIVRGPNLEPVQLEEQQPKPVYLTRHAEIERYTSDPAERARLGKLLDEDRNHPLRLAAKEAGRRNEEAQEAWSAVYKATVAVRPTTPAGALALMQLVEDRDGDMALDWDIIGEVFAGVRAVIGGRV